MNIYVCLCVFSRILSCKCHVVFVNVIYHVPFSSYINIQKPKFKHKVATHFMSSLATFSCRF
jgi:hypothetical protein